MFLCQLENSMTGRVVPVAGAQPGVLLLLHAAFHIPASTYATHLQWDLSKHAITTDKESAL